MMALALRYGNGPTLLKDIARLENISEKYLGQIIIPLKGAGLVNSVRGAHGGYLLNQGPQRITVKEIVQALEGKLHLVEPIDKSAASNGSSLYIGSLVWKKLEDSIVKTLTAITLEDLVTLYRDNNKDVPMYNI